MISNFICMIILEKRIHNNDIIAISVENVKKIHVFSQIQSLNLVIVFSLFGQINYTQNMIVRRWRNLQQQLYKIVNKIICA